MAASIQHAHKTCQFCLAVVVEVLRGRHLILTSRNLLWVDQVQLSTHRQCLDLRAAGLLQKIRAEERSRSRFTQSKVAVVAADQDLILAEALHEVLTKGVILFELIFDVASDVAEIDGGLNKRQNAFLD